MGALILVLGFALLSGFLLKLLLSKPPFLASLEGRHVAVTGASSGIGLSLAKRCLIEGAFVTIMARTEKNLLKAREALIEQVRCPRNRILLKTVDVACPSAIETAIRESFNWKPIDVLVCNAGIARGGFLEQVPVSELEAQFRINFLGTVYPVHAALPLMKQRSQRNPTSIVFIGSLTSLYFACGATTYMASKCAQKGLAELLKVQLLPNKINVQMVIPGYTETAMLDEVVKFNSEAPLWKRLFMFDREKAQTTDEVAVMIVEAMKRGNYLTTTAMDGYILGILGRGLLPDDRLLNAALELLLLLPLRLLTFLWALILLTLVRRQPVH